MLCLCFLLGGIHTLPLKLRYIELCMYDIYVYNIHVYDTQPENVWLEDDPFLLGVGLVAAKNS